MDIKTIKNKFVETNLKQNFFIRINFSHQNWDPIFETALNFRESNLNLYILLTIVY